MACPRVALTFLHGLIFSLLHLVRGAKTSFDPLTTSQLSKLLHYVKNLSIAQVIRDRISVWDMVALMALCGLFRVYTRGRWQRNEKDAQGIPNEGGAETDAVATDPTLLKTHSTYKSYSTPVATYPQIRTFYRPHPHADKLPTEPKPLPLLVFIHGLGGSMAQFNPIMKSLINVGSCFGIDLPGCGASGFQPKDWEAYSHRALVELLIVAISETCSATEIREVVLIGHSMGCSLAVSIASPLSSFTRSEAFSVVGIVAICPKISSPTADQVNTFRKLLSIPTPVFNLWRKWDRRGGIDSVSVARFVGAANVETRRLQMRFNEQSRTPVWRRMAWGALPTFKNGSAEGGLPLLDVWMAVSVPLFLVAGESDTTTKPDEVLLFRDAVASNQTDIGTELGSVSSADSKSPMMGRTKDSTSIAEHLTIDRRRVSALKTCILPKPASHGLLYDFATYRTLAGLIQTFLSDYLDFRLSLGWQLHHMKDANKWDVKNLAKWQAVNPVSEPIGGIFRAMKVLRETDSIHSPAQFVEGWKDKINAVIDISHDPPVYSPQALSTAGIEYHKFPTVSKIPPTSEEVKGFIVLVNNIRASVAEGDQRQTCVHCHYGFNRTGFFICSYLVESMGYSVQDAIDEFAKRRPPGIRHDHFIDTLFVRYCVGLKRAPTL